MRLSISNLAWEPLEDEVIAGLLRKYGIDAIDIAPGRYFPRPTAATTAELSVIKRAWAQRGIEVVGMQALLFGTPGLNLFGPSETQAAMLRQLREMCRIGAALGATRLVFGAPKNRDRSGLEDKQVFEIALAFFEKLGDIAASYGVTMCLEPNPPCYGANFMTSSAETAAIVRAVNHPAIKMQLDTGAMAINGEPAEAVIRDCASIIAHIHASEPNLVPLGDSYTNHGVASAAIQRYLPEHIVTIEMAATQNEPHEVSVERALRVAIAYYRDGI